MCADGTPYSVLIVLDIAVAVADIYYELCGLQ
jgi:hypothetical protein